MRRTRKAYIEETQDDSTWSRWTVILRSWVMTTPSTRRESTRSVSLAEERRARWEARSETGLQRSVVHNQLQIARQVLKFYTKCVWRQEASVGHHACKHKPRHIWGY